MKFFTLVLLTSMLLTGCENNCCDREGSKLGESAASLQAIITGVPDEIVCGDSIKASGLQSHDTDGKIVSYEWSVDGQAVSVTTESSLVLPCDDQKHKICLTVTDDEGKEAKSCKKVFVTKDTDKILIPGL